MSLTSLQKRLNFRLLKSNFVKKESVSLQILKTTEKMSLKKHLLYLMIVMQILQTRKANLRKLLLKLKMMKKFFVKKLRILNFRLSHVFFMHSKEFVKMHVTVLLLYIFSVMHVVVASTKSRLNVSLMLNYAKKLSFVNIAVVS